jgi:UDP-N-acetylglucosamine transferase subunit ALG13
VKVFVTVGSALPFDRLVAAADAWAARHPDASVVAQIGDSGLRPRAMDHRAMFEPAEYRRRCQEADVIVSHAGMGTVITAAEVGRPLVVLPRRPERGEVTSGHQLATVRWLRGRPGLVVIESESELGAAIASASTSPGMRDFSRANRERIVACVREFLLRSIGTPR